MEITTNNVPRDIIDGWELTADERKEFDYVNWDKVESGEDSVSFFRYKGDLYDVSEFMLTNVPKWNGIQPDSYFSGILIRYVENFERVVVGRFFTG